MIKFSILEFRLPPQILTLYFRNSECFRQNEDERDVADDCHTVRRLVSYLYRDIDPVQLQGLSPTSLSLQALIWLSNAKRTLKA